MNVSKYAMRVLGAGALKICIESPSFIEGSKIEGKGD
jgi:hypothetical protein